MPEKKSCFVIMGFGEKVDFETGRKLNLDASYKNVIKPAVEAAGLECVRADELAPSGVMDVPMYERILLSDVVVADVSTANCNAFYELGVRHALRPSTTIIVCEDQFKFPFDINRNKILKYKHLGEDIGYGEAKRFAETLTKTVADILKQDPPADDSPVYTYLHGLRRLKLPDDLKAGAAAADAANTAKSVSVFRSAEPPAPDQTHGALMEQVDKAQEAGDFGKAKALLGAVRAMRPDDPYITQRLALVTYKDKSVPVRERFEEARDLLAALNPATSNDTETLGLWGAVHKRLWDETQVKDYLDESIRGYERGFYLRNDHYNGINFAFVLNVRAAHAADPAEAIADFVQARRVREEVITICDAWLSSSAPHLRAFSYGFEGGKSNETYLLGNRYWVLASKAEAYLGTGRDAEAAYQAAYDLAPAPWMIETTKQQRARLEAFLAASPLKYIRADAG